MSKQLSLFDTPEPTTMGKYKYTYVCPAKLASTGKAFIVNIKEPGTYLIRRFTGKEAMAYCEYYDDYGVFKMEYRKPKKQ